MTKNKFIVIELIQIVLFASIFYWFNVHQPRGPQFELYKALDRSATTTPIVTDQNDKTKIGVQSVDDLFKRAEEIRLKSSSAK